ncbi:MAG TPA: RNA polymerase factor sigma-54 [Candidatus Binatia bacterium]|nr:RNA polymerase factor sigma-54 [Candidatus Binatia bacterium]
MALETRLYQKLSQQLVMTPQLRQAIKILQVSRAELEELIDQELTENPALEEEIGLRSEEDEQRPRTEENLETQPTESPDAWDESPDAQRETTSEVAPESPTGEIDWKEYLENYRNDWQGATATPADYDEDKRPALENTLVRSSSLTEHLIWQLRMAGLTPLEESVAALMIGNIDEAGYLRVPIEDIAFQCGQDIEIVERTLARIQELDPPGVGARDLRECLLLQLRYDGQGDSLAARVVADHLVLLESKRYDKIAKELNVPVEEVVTAANTIATLEPKPGRNFGEGDIRYITPDVSVQKVDGEFVVTLNEEGLPRLRVSSFYRNVLGNQETSDAKRYIQEKMRAAAWLIKSIHQRQRTLFMVTSSIVKFQRDFLERGISHLKPLVLKDVAMDIGMHESTVSRATANKYVHTAQGIYELKFFFTSSLNRSDGGEDVSAESVKERIRGIISAEDARQPLSDQHIAQMLAKEGVDIARRTVAKYREMMAILPSSKRRQVY